MKLFILQEQNKCISEWLVQVAVWYRTTPGPKFTKFRK